MRNTLRREEGWAQWKKGAPPPLPTPKDGKGPACPDYERPPLRPPIAERVAEGAAGAGAAAAKAGARREA